MIRPDRIKRALIRYLPLTPAIFLAVLIPRYWVDLPQYDEWDSVTFFEHLSQGSLTAGLLFKQANEYRQFFPNVIVVALGWLTRWDIRYDMVVTFVIACLISVNVWRLAARTIQEDPLKFSLLIFLGNLIIFSPTQYENWLQGQQMVYYLPILCVTAAVLVTRSNLATLSKFLICAGLSTISMFSSANGVVCWVVVLPMLLFTDWRKNRRLTLWLSLAWIAGLGLCVALYLHGYQKPWWTPSPLTALHHPVRALIYFLGFVGGPFGLERVRLSIVAGVVLTTGFVWSLIYVVKHRADRRLVERAIGWLVIGSYSVLTAALTTVGRLGLATGPSQVPRYLGFSAYLPLALIFLAFIIGHDIQRRNGRVYSLRFHPLTFTTIAAIILYQPFMFALSFRQMDAWQTRLLQAKASILLINHLPDTRLTKILYPNLQFLIEKSNALDRLGFMRPSLVKSKHLREFSDDTGNYGDMRPIEKTADGYAASGMTTLAKQRVPDAIILAYDLGDKDPIAFAMSHPVKRPASMFESLAQTGAWFIRFTPEQLPPAPVTVTAWAFDATTGRAFRLSGASRINTAQ
ncbi:MAG TPA: hypothetical protein DC054_18955 [Blastocatellia bacterium]|nr:hypothetical protein [Blastocatellia bacterium]